MRADDIRNKVDNIQRARKDDRLLSHELRMESLLETLLLHEADKEEDRERAFTKPAGVTDHTTLRKAKK